MHEYFQAALGAAIGQPGIDAFLNLLTPDAVLEDPVGTPPHRGREAIGQFLAALSVAVERGEFTVGEIFTCGNESAVRWTVNVWTKKGKHVVLDGIGFFEFAEPRKLRRIREFWDAALMKELVS
jgi:steroid delta-isomerase